MTCEGADTGAGADPAEPSTIPELGPAWGFLGAPTVEGVKMNLGWLWVRLTLCAAWAELEYAETLDEV